MILGWLVAAVLCLIAGVIAYRKWMGNIREMRRRMGVVKTFLWFVGAALCLVLGFFSEKRYGVYPRNETNGTCTESLCKSCNYWRGKHGRICSGI